MIKGARSIAEYAIRRWLENQRFEMSAFVLDMDGSRGVLRDRNGDSMTLVYDRTTHEVYVEE